MELDLQLIKQQVAHVTEELLKVANLKAGDVFVLGCSSSEICGGHIGKASSKGFKYGFPASFASPSRCA